MVKDRAACFANDIKGWTLPLLEVLYITNLSAFIEGNHTYIDPWMSRVDQKLIELDKNGSFYWDKYAYVIFFKAFLFKLQGDWEEALSLLHEVLSLENIIERETHLIPQSCYEIALINRKNLKEPEAKRWLNKACKYTGYVTQDLLEWRCKYALEHMKPMQYDIPDKICDLPL